VRDRPVIDLGALGGPNRASARLPAPPARCAATTCGQLGPVPHRRPDVEDRLLADEHVIAEGDRTGLDHAVAGAVAADE
jgi:hypothetical protein